MDERFTKQIAFLIEIDKIKNIIRRTKLFSSDRRENDAEHSWHLAMMVLILSEYSHRNIDILKVLKMVLIHDIVEIDAGDILFYNKNAAVKDKEIAAAERIFGLLPEEQKREYISLWAEFEEKKTPEAAFAAAVDRLEPILQNYLAEKSVWAENNISAERLLEANRHIGNGSEKLWEYAEGLILECRENGLIS